MELLPPHFQGNHDHRAGKIRGGTTILSYCCDQNIFCVNIKHRCPFWAVSSKSGVFSFASPCLHLTYIVTSVC